MKNSPYHNLRKSLEKRQEKIKEKIVTKHADALGWVSNNTKQLAAGAMGGLLLLSSPYVQLLPQVSSASASASQFLDIKGNIFLVSQLENFLPHSPGQLIPGQEEQVAKILSDYFGFSVKREIDGKRLMHTYGYIGAEQHLVRYPGDTMESHFDNQKDSVKVASSGMAPGRGAFSYFVNSQEKMTQKDVDREKYYIAVQTFLIPDYAQNTSKYRDFFRYRKMLVVNPQNGHAVVAVVGDVGPAVWTGKQLGGSPEVMQHLERVDGAQKGGVLYFFIDDPKDEIPLGPIEKS